MYIKAVSLRRSLPVAAELCVTWSAMNSTPTTANVCAMHASFFKLFFILMHISLSQHCIHIAYTRFPHTKDSTYHKTAHNFWHFTTIRRYCLTISCVKENKVSIFLPYSRAALLTWCMPHGSILGLVQTSERALTLYRRKRSVVKRRRNWGEVRCLKKILVIRNSLLISIFSTQHSTHNSNTPHHRRKSSSSSRINNTIYLLHV